MTQSAKDFKSDSITTVIADTISDISTSISNVASNVSTLTTSVADVQTTITTIATPKISSITYSGDDTAADPAGGQTITLNGLNFVTGAIVLINNQPVSVVSVVDSETITFTSPALAAGSYIVYVINTDGGTGISIPGIQYSGVPAWSTTAGSLGTVYETASISQTLSATGDAPVTYSLASGTLPPGATLNSDGTITGTSEITASSTTYTFTIKASDAQNQDTNRQFSITINPDSVTWSNPSLGASISLDGTAYSSSLSATSAAGQSITYTANALPTGLTLSSGTISGTPTVEGNVSTLLTATSANTNRSATNTITWVVSLGDAYWKYTSLLLNGSTPTPTFINDASLNNAQIKITGDVRPAIVNPYTNGYFCNSFDGASNYIYTAHNAGLDFGTGDFTIEFWLFPKAWSSGTAGVVGKKASDSTNGWQIYRNSGQPTKMSARLTQQNDFYTTSTIDVGVWTHWAVVRTGTTLYWFKNGVLDATGSSSANIADNTTGLYVGFAQTWNAYGNFDISNLRIVKGTAVYTSAFTKPTTPATAIANTQFLSCQSYGFIDNSPNNISFSVYNSPTIPARHPFSPPTTVSYYNQYSTLFDGNGDYITSASSASLALASSDFTVELWYRATGRVQNYPYLIGNGPFDSDRWQICDRHQSANTKILVNMNNASASDGWMVSTTTVVEGTWYHVALVRSGSTFKLYVNGVAEATNTYAGSITGASDSITIGMDGSQSISAYTGYISNVRIVKGTAVYTSNFTPSTTPLTAITNTVLLTCQDNTVKDNSSNNFTLTTSGQVQPFTISPFASMSTTMSVSNLGSAYFDGSGDNLMIASNPAYSLGSGDFTIECWIYITGSQTQTYGHGVMGTYDGLSNNGWSIVVNKASNAHGLDFIIANNTQLQYTTYLNTNTWYHIAVIRSGTLMRQLLNGIDVGTLTYSTADNVVAPLYIGSQGASSCFFPGYISNIRIVKGTALYVGRFSPPLAPPTPVANTQLLTCQYNGGANNNGFVDQSGFNNIITRNGNPTQGTFSPFSQTGWSNYFDGSSGYLTTSGSTSNALGSGDYTIEFWCYSNSLGGSSAGCMFYVDMGGYQQLLRHNGVWECYYKSGLAFTVSISTIPINKWVHQALVRSSGTVKWYINGVEYGSASDATNYSSSTFFQIGNYAGYNYDGYISNVRVVKGTAVYTAAFTPPTAPLSAIPGTIFLSSNSNRFIDNSYLNNALTVTGSPKIQAFSPFGGVTSVPTSYSGYFNGSTDYLTVPAMVTTYQAWNWTGSWTIEGWFNFNSVTATKGLFAYPDLLEAKYDGTNLVFAFRHATGPAWATNTTAYALQTNTWYHIALVLNGSSMRAYVNGQAIGTASTGIGTGARGSTTGMGEVFIIGANDSYTFGSPDSFMSGYISNFRITNAAVYTGNFTTPTTELQTTQSSGTNISALTTGQVSLLTCKNNTFKDNTSNNWTITSATTTVKPLPFNPFGMTNTSQVSYSPSVNGGSMYFDGTGDKLSIDNYPALAFGTRDFTIQAWFYTKVASTEQVIMTNGWASYAPWLIRINASNQLMLNMSTDGGSWVVNEQALATVTTGQWYHVAVTRTSGTLRGFVNGVQAYSTSLSSSLYNGSQALNVGGRSDTSVPFNGYLSDCQLINGTSLYSANFLPPVSPVTATSDTTMLLNGTSSGIIDYHSSNDLETVGDLLLAPEDPYNGSYYSNYFDGSGDYFTLPQSTNLAFSGDYTIECWVYLISVTGLQGVYSSIDNSSDTWQGPYLGFSGTSFLATSYISANDTITHQTAVDAGKWYHIAIVRNGSSTKSYLNGVQSTGTTTSTYSLTQSGSTIGSAYPGTSPLNGYISNLRVVKGTAVYTTSFTPSTAPLTAISGTQLLTCQSNKFIDNSTNNLTLTITGDTKVKSMNPFQQNTGKSLYFDGTGDYLTMPGSPALILSGDFTIEGWVYCSAAFSSAPTILCLGSPGASAYHGVNCRISSTGAFSTTFSINGTTTALNMNSSTTYITQNSWVHFAYVRSGSTITLFVNGVSDISGTLSGTLYSSQYNTIGAAYNSGYINPWNGYMKDLRITKYARYTTTFTPPTSPMQTK